MVQYFARSVTLLSILTIY